MSSKVKIVIECDAEGTKGTIEFDSVTQRLKTTGELYPWVIRSLIEWIDKHKNLLEKAKGEN